MLPKPEPACVVIANISGYTGHLAGVELDHAQDILADLIETIVGALRPPFHLSKLEGDAAFVYVPAPLSTARSCRTRSRRPISSSVIGCAILGRRRPANAMPAGKFRHST